MFRDITKYYSSIPLLCIGVYALYELYFMGGNCGGAVNTYAFILAGFIYLLALVIVLVISIVNTIMKKTKFNFIPLITTALMFGLLFLVPAMQNWVDSPPTLYAMIRGENLNKQYALELKKDNTYELQVGTVEYGCTYKGSYKMKGDTLLIANNYNTQTDSMFSNKYVIDKTNQSLYPLTDKNAIGDNAKWMRIIFPKN